MANEKEQQHQIERFTTVGYSEYADGGMRPMFDGEWVRYSDYLSSVTSIRSRCVEKVKEMAEGWLVSSRQASDDARSNIFYERCNAARRIAEELKSLRLNQVEQENR